MKKLVAATWISLPLVLLVACGGGDEHEEQVVPASGVESAGESARGMPGMEGMEAMPDAQDSMMGRMMAHMQMMRGMSADSIRAVLPTHRQMLANMIARMNREMRDMNMAADAPWTATVDSLRQDLVRMPELTGAELEAMMPAHHQRAVRLMEMHREMMRGMGR